MDKIALSLCCIFLFKVSFAEGQYMYGSDSKLAVEHFISGWHHIMDLGEWTKAEEYFRLAVEEDPNFTIGKTLVGRISRDFEEREAILLDLADERPRLGQSEKLLYDIFYASIKAMNDRSSGADAKKEKRAQRLRKNLELFQEFVNLHPSESYIKAEYIETIAASMGAKEALEKILKACSKEELELGFYKTYRAGLHTELGQFEEAENLLNSFASKFSDYKEVPAISYSFANFHYSRGELEKAFENYKLAVDLDPNHLLAISGREKCMSELQILLDTEDLRIKQFSKNTLLHQSFLDSRNFGRVGCNGLVAFNEGEAIVFDTPTNIKASQSLLDFLQEELKLQVKLVVPTHHHVDCLAGLEVFHKNGIPSLSLKESQLLAKEDGWALPKATFKRDTVINLGGEDVYVFFPGEGHTKDNVVAYYPKDSILFGGCLIKSLDAPKGNLADANLNEWSRSVEKVKMTFPRAKSVIPGHGRPGGLELIDYTIDLFKADPILLDQDGKVLDYAEHPGQSKKVVFETVANASRGYSYEIVDFDSTYTSVRILKDGEVEFEYIAGKREESIDLSEIDRRRGKWIALCNQHDAAVLVERLYSAEAIYYNHKPMLRGRSEITADYQYMNRPNYSLLLSPLKVYPVSPRLVFEIGQCSGSYGGKYIIIWKKEDDGAWRVFLDSNI